jgi:hypothetical protein
LSNQAGKTVCRNCANPLSRTHRITPRVIHGFGLSGDIRPGGQGRNQHKFQCPLGTCNYCVPGISIANSEVGILALSIQAFYYRLICTNGMIAKTAVDARYKHISRKVMDEFPMILEGVISQSRHGQNRFMISTNTPVDNPESAIDTFARQFQITQKETEIVRQAFYLEQGGTMFHIINAFTRAAQDRSLSASDSYRLERAGGAILGMVKS